MTIARLFIISLLLVFLFTPTTANAAKFSPIPPTPPPCPKNFIFPCRSEVQTLIINALQPIETALGGIQNTIADIQSSLSQLTTTVNTTQNNQTTDEATISSQGIEITNLQASLSALLNQQPPQPTDFVFFNNQQIPLNGDVDSQTFDAQGFSKIVFSYKCNGNATNGTSVTLFVSPDKINGVPQYSVSPDQCLQGGSVSLDTGGRYYTVEIGNDTNIVTPRPSVNALGHFSN
ncbi:MAG TPA: hypothetical protein VND99_03665 [Candidatus Acidoferrales bacterium]|nr:hypothetical protein [Candidatus Acidoferrales bacterium]